MPSAPRPTLRDVARAAGVSHITVSRVVRGSPQVAEATAARVRRVIRRMGYRPDPVLSALAAYRMARGEGDSANTTASPAATAGDAEAKPARRRSAQTRSRGSVLAFLDCDLHRNSRQFNRDTLQGIRREAALLGYGVESFRMEPDEAIQKRLGRMLFHRGVRGLLFSPTDVLWTFTGWDWAEFAPVSLGALDHEPAMHSVAMDYFQGAAQGFDKLARMGCRRIGLVVDSRLEARTGHRWLGGFLAQGGARSRYYGEGGLHAPALFLAWAAREKLDGVLTIDPVMAKLLPGMPLVYLNNLGAPEGFLRPVLNPETVGAEGVRLLHNMLLRHELGIPAERRRIELQGRWTTAERIVAAR
ncbi:LacI family transcriptional regulator [Verrucomicrobia bacterium LW23]|nr:LacI family transcriptional regulator [Verrucomicrobia bacterium LW23]